MPYAKKKTATKSKAFKTCRGCSTPAKCKKAKKCMAKSKR